MSDDVVIDEIRRGIRHPCTADANFCRPKDRRPTVQRFPLRGAVPGHRAEGAPVDTPRPMDRALAEREQSVMELRLRGPLVEGVREVEPADVERRRRRSRSKKRIRGQIGEVRHDSVPDIQPAGPPVGCSVGPGRMFEATLLSRKPVWGWPTASISNTRRAGATSQATQFA